MKENAVYNFHLPLPAEIRAMLREEVETTGRAATAIAREALETWLRQRCRARLTAEIAAYATAEAGTAVDLDEVLERAAVEALCDEDTRETG